MVTAPIFEGTLEELFWRRNEFAGLRLSVFATPQEEQDLPAPLTTVRDQAHLEALLLAGLQSPKQKVTEATWEHIRQEVRRAETQEENHAP